MYIFIFEDGSMVKMGSISREDMEAYNDGLVTFIDCGSPDMPSAYVDGEWLEIPEGDWMASNQAPRAGG